MKLNLPLAGLLLAVALLAGRSDASAMAGDLKQPGVALPTKYPEAIRKKIRAALNREDCKFVSGSFVNWFTTLRYDSDTKALNLFLDDLKNIPQVTLKVSFVKSIEHESAAWSVHHGAHGNRFHIRVPLDGRIKIEELYIPDIQGRSPTEAGDEMVKLGFEEFHHKAGRGWRAFADLGMYTEAADIIQKYLSGQGALSRFQRASLHFHAAHNHARVGTDKAIEAALKHLEQARLAPESHVRSGPSWNDFVTLTEAALKQDDAGLRTARKRVGRDLRLPFTEQNFAEANEKLQDIIPRDVSE
jgi:hypothetical protein